MRDNVHDVAVTLDRHLLRHFDAAELRDATEVVASEIDQHDVLGPFFWIDNQFLRELFVFRCIFPAAPRPGDRTNFGYALTQEYMNLRRTSYNREIFSELETKHIRRRIAEPERAIKIESVTPKLGLETLRQHNLKNFAGRDEFLGLSHHCFEFVSRRVALSHGKCVDSFLTD